MRNLSKRLFGQRHTVRAQIHANTSTNNDDVLGPRDDKHHHVAAVQHVAGEGAGQSESDAEEGEHSLGQRVE